MDPHPNLENLNPANLSLRRHFYWSAVELRQRCNPPTTEILELYTANFAIEHLPRFISSRTPDPPVKLPKRTWFEITDKNDVALNLRGPYFIGSIAINQAITMPDQTWYGWGLIYEINSIKRSIKRFPYPLKIVDAGITPDPQLEFEYNFKEFPTEFVTTEAWQLMDFFNRFPADANK